LFAVVPLPPASNTLVLGADTGAGFEAVAAANGLIVVGAIGEMAPKGLGASVFAGPPKTPVAAGAGVLAGAPPNTLPVG